MTKRKCSFASSQTISLSSLDAALDLLACETFTRLEHLSTKFEAAAGIKLNDGVVQKRWEDAVARYWMMKGLDGLSCATKAAGGLTCETANGERRGGVVAVKVEREDDMEMSDGKADAGCSSKRPLPSSTHPGVERRHKLNTEEMLEWTRWHPKVGDVVLVDLPDDKGLWPGKIIDRKAFFQGRTVPRGNHFFPVRIYNDNMEPVITIKSRLIPLHLRSDPPLLASEALLSAYNHAANPSSFDMRASARESLAAHQRTHPGVGDDTDMAKVKAEKEAWNKTVNWVMNERRVEKLRALEVERHKRLAQVAASEFEFEGKGEKDSIKDDDAPKKRRKAKSLSGCDGLDNNSCTIFGPAALKSEASALIRPSSPAAARSLASLIRPALSLPSRPISPRRRMTLIGYGEKSPRSRGGTYTPPRILPSGDETAVPHSDSPVPSRPRFDFVSPLGPVKLGVLSKATEAVEAERTESRRGSLGVVKEEADEIEDDGEGWTVVQGRKTANGSRDDKSASVQGMTVDA